MVQRRCVAVRMKYESEGNDHWSLMFRRVNDDVLPSIRVLLTSLSLWTKASLDRD